MEKGEPISGECGESNFEEILNVFEKNVSRENELINILENISKTLDELFRKESKAEIWKEQSR